MHESDEVFYNRIDESHVQFEETKKLLEKCRNGEMVTGLSQIEEQSILNDLRQDELVYSNDMIIDWVIRVVRKSSNDDKLNELLDKLKVSNISDNVIGRAYQQYSDGSYYIEIGREMFKRLLILSDLLAVLFMQEEKLTKDESFILKILLNVNLERYDKNEDITYAYSLAQRLILFYEKKGNKNFSDNYVAYSLKIQEMALAFLIGHEIGHDYYGHTVKNEKTELSTKLTREIDADRFGYDFALTYLKSDYKTQDNRYGAHQFAGIFVPLIASEYFNEKNKMEISGGHPPIVTRIEDLKLNLKRDMDKTVFLETWKKISYLLKMIDFLPENKKGE